MTHRSLRVALLAGSLTQGGAEKQLVYMARALRDQDVAVRVFTLTRGEFYEAALERHGLAPIWIGRRSNPVLRIVRLARLLRSFRPHIVQAAHFFANLHVTGAAALVGAQAIGSLRNDATFEVRANGRWGPWLLRLPPALIANSAAAVRNAAALGAAASRIHVVPNVVDLEDFDRGRDAAPRSGPRTVAAVACRLVPAKRVDRFLRALATARGTCPDLHGVVIGDGPERLALEQMAGCLGLRPDGVSFLGRRDDVPALLSGADMLVLSSDHEGFPNVVLEAMAARLPVITTPAGDAGAIVRDDATGFVVPFDDVETMADRMISLAIDPELRRTMGECARSDVERRHTRERLGDRLLAIYAEIAARSRRMDLAAALAG